MFIASFQDNPTLNAFLIAFGLIGITVIYFIFREFLDRFLQPRGEEDENV